VDEAIAQKNWLILGMHSVDYSGDIYSITPANLLELVTYIKAQVDAGNIRAVTVGDGVSQSTQAAWEPIYDTNMPIQHNLVITNGRLLWFFGNDIVDYTFDGYEWVKSGKAHYWEWHGDYHSADSPSGIALQSISSTKATAQFTLTDGTNGDFDVVSQVTLLQGRPLAEVRITEINGTAAVLSLAKYLTRRFSTTDGSLVTDGSIETGLRVYGAGHKSLFAWDDTTDQIRILTESEQKVYSEYADYEEGEFRSREISAAFDLPFVWYVGGISFDTLNLLSEAEKGSLTGGSSFYTDVDASPKTGQTGVVLDAGNDTVTMQFTPPYPGNYILSIRQKGISPGDQYSYQIDNGETIARTAVWPGFGYENIPLGDITAQSHTISVSRVSGMVIVDYVLLIPTSRSSNTPVSVEFPADITYPGPIFLPFVALDLHP
jgi:hypothetical protein